MSLFAVDMTVYISDAKISTREPLYPLHTFSKVAEKKKSSLPINSDIMEMADKWIEQGGEGITLSEVPRNRETNQLKVKDNLATVYQPRKAK